MGDQAIAEFGRLDVLVNNAGILRDKMIFSMAEDDFDSVIRVHLKGTWCMSRHASAYWREQSKAGDQPRAAIVNTVSSAGLQGQASQSNYGAAKAGIAAMTIIASLELKRYGVRANCIGPGGATRMVAQAMKIDVKHPEDYTEFEAMNPGNSAPGVVWLAPEPAAPFGRLIAAACAAFPSYPPYGGTIDEPTPHLTIAEGGAIDADATVAAANPHLPFERAVSAITVIAEQSPGRWRVRWRLPLRR